MHKSGWTHSEASKQKKSSSLRAYYAKRRAEEARRAEARANIPAPASLTTVAEVLATPKFNGAWWDGRGVEWTPTDCARLEILCAANVDPEKAADAIGRAPQAIAWRAKETGLVLPEAWRKLVRRKYVPKERAPPRIQLAYPFVIRKRDEHADLLAVNALVSQYLPGREDVCQEIMLAMWEGKITVDELRRNRNNLRAFVRSFKSANFEMGGYGVSMDAMIPGTDLRLGDTFSTEDGLWA